MTRSLAVAVIRPSGRVYCTARTGLPGASTESAFATGVVARPLAAQLEPPTLADGAAPGRARP